MSVNLAAGKKANLREIRNLDCSGYTRNAPKTIVFGAFCYVKNSDFQMTEKFDPHRDPHRAKNAAHRQGSSASRPVRCFACWKCFYRIPRGIAAYREIYFSGIVNDLILKARQADRNML